MAAADAAEKTAGDTARAAADEAAAARESALAAEALAAASAAELEAARQKVDTLRRRADAAERSARVHVDLAAEAAAYGRELNSDPAFRARKAEAFAAAVVEAENFLRYDAVSPLRAIAEAKEVKAAADAAERTAAGVATAEIERSLEFRAIADDAEGISRFRRLAADAESEVREAASSTTRSRCTATWASAAERHARGVPTRRGDRRCRTTRRGVRGPRQSRSTRARSFDPSCRRGLGGRRKALRRRRRRA